MSGFAQMSFDGAVFHPDSVLAAVHVLARRLTVTLEADGRGGTLARVAPAEGAAALRDEAAAQELRRRIAAGNRTLREYIVTRSLLSAGTQTGAPALQDVGELDGLLTEVEREIAEKIAHFAQEAERGRSRDLDPGGAP